MLSRRNLVVLGFCRNTQGPQIVIKLFHELINRWANSPKVMLFEFLSLARRSSEQRAARHDEILTLFVILLRNKEIFLFGTNGSYNTVTVFTKELQNALSLFVNYAHRTQKRRLFIESLARIRAKCCRNAKDFIFNKRVARWIPCGVATSFKCCTQTT